MVATIVVGTNSYETEAEADTYLEAAVHGTAWATATNKVESLITAYRDISLMTLVDPVTGLAVDPSSAPQPVKDAQSELALVLSSSPASAQASGQGGTNIKSAGAGSAKVVFFRPEDKTRFPTIVSRLLAPYIGAGASAAGGIQGSCASGVDGTSSFDTGGSLLTEGYK